MSLASQPEPYIPAGPTTYNGIKMRSRLEARFAADMDRAPGVVWAYEPRAYASQRGQYLPDFELLEYDGVPVNRPAFFEVRPTVERGYLAMEQMAVIWDSEPNAQLWVAVPRTVWWTADGNDDRVWRVIWLP